MPYPDAAKLGGARCTLTSWTLRVHEPGGVVVMATPVAVARGLQLRVLQRGQVVMRSATSMGVSCCTVRIRRVSGGAHSAGGAVHHQGLMCAMRALLRLRLLMQRYSTLRCLVQMTTWLMIRHPNLVHWILAAKLFRGKDTQKVKIPGRFCPHWNERTNCLDPDRTAPPTALQTALDAVWT